MRNDILRANVVATKLIASLDDEMKKAFGLKPEHNAIGLITGSMDDVTFISLDEATKVADVEVVYSESVFSCFVGEFTKFAGEALGIIAGASPAEVKSGLEACSNYIENGPYFVSAHDEGYSIYLSHCISRSGSYLSKVYGVEQGEPIAYCVAPPIESLYALDKALKAADVKLMATFKPPTPTTNFGGGIMTGSQSACQAACDAFSEGVHYVANNPLII